MRSTPFWTLVYSFFMALTVSASAQDAVPLQFPGFSTFPTPRTFDKPGTIFRVTPDGQRFTGTAIDLPIHHGDETFSSKQYDSTWRLSTLAKFLNFVASLGASAEHSSKVRVTLGPAERLWTNDDEVDAALKGVKLAFTRPGTYYLIRETIQVSEISYQIESEWAAELKAGAKALENVAADVSTEWSSKGDNSLVQKFSLPHFIFFLPEKLLTPLGASSALTVRLPVDGRVQWTSEEK